MVILDETADERRWQLSDGTLTWTAVASRAGPLDVVRLPRQPPSMRWSVSFESVRAPARGSADVVELARPRDAIPQRPAQWLVGALLVGVLVALHGYHSAGRRALRSTVRSIAFGGIVVVGIPPLAAQLQDAAPNVPQLVGVAMILAPLFALAVAAATARLLTAAVPVTDVPPRTLRLATALTALVLLALAAYAAELTAARYFPGLGW